jgi:hypothetical protein
MTQPRPEDLTPEDMELVPSPIASHVPHRVPRYQARILDDLVPDFMVVRRTAAAAVSGNWDTLEVALSEAEAAGRLQKCLRAALTELAVVAIDGAQGDRDLAADYFEALVLMQMQMDDPGAPE